MYHFGFLFAILISLGVATYIVISKFSQLKNLNIDVLSREKEQQVKKDIIDKRLEEQVGRFNEKLKKYLQPVIRFWGEIQLKFRIYVGKVQKMMHYEEELKKEGIKPTFSAGKEKESENNIDGEFKIKKVAVTEDSSSAQKAKLPTEDQVELLVKKAEHDLQNKLYEKAEEKFISAIKIDQRNVPAYRGLADTYLEMGNIEEARQIYKFVLELEPDDDSVQVALAQIAESQGDIEEAIEYYQKSILINDSFASRFFKIAKLLNNIGQPETAKEAILQAVELEPENEEYLDLLTNIAIILQDKELAREALNSLKTINFENKNIKEYSEKIVLMN